MQPKTITIDNVKYVREDSLQQVPQPEGNYVIVRCRNAGVHAGYLEGRTQHVLTLINSRRLWRWWSEFTLSALAMKGPHPDRLDENLYATTLPRLDLTVSDVCEVIYCTEEAREAIQAVGDHNG